MISNLYNKEHQKDLITIIEENNERDIFDNAYQDGMTIPKFKETGCGVLKIISIFMENKIDGDT